VDGAGSKRLENTRRFPAIATAPFPRSCRPRP
jgi:hypothetical protein